ncbi:DJ-1/PfpI family protein, partial [Streptomyces sp. Root264]|uniref:DJ-1/PfpI family protein n=2 Tax=Streptomyces TaxID=1883 RepID=UPI001F5BDD2F
MLNNVVAILLDGVHPFELGVVCEVFGIDRSDEGLPVYDFAVASAEGPTLSTHAGFTMSTPHGLERLESADLIAVPAGDTYGERDFPPELLDALRRAVDRGTRVLSVCSGAFVLGAAGLLDGRRCAVHWRHAERLARQYPRTVVEPDVLYVDEDPVITSAGTAAGIDACLHIVRKEQGPEVANRIARRMVVPPHRDGGQAQYIERPLPRSRCDTVGEVLAWMEQHLDQEITVERLAERAHMSPRTFAR